MRPTPSRRPKETGGPDPIGRRIRSLRIARGLSLQRLSDLVGAAPSHIFHVENGAKVPSEPLAARIARALGEDEGAFRAWSRLRQRTSVSAALAAAAVLADYMARDAGGGGEAPSPPTRGQPVSGPARLLVPLLADTADPGESTRPPGSIGTLRLDAADLGAAADLDRPFAYRAGGAGLSRVPDLAAEGTAVVLTRRVLPFEPNEVYAVRAGGGVSLARALWNGRELLLLPAPGASDFAVLPAPGAEALARLVAGRVVLARVPAPAEPARS
ncbi:MAG TPA: helix-turn-helix transcriptional regulator [Candidatus Eisenbacteria bacterium]